MGIVRERLSDAEVDVLDMMSRGVAGKEIAHRLGVSYSMVQYHRREIVRRLGARSMYHAIYLWGLLQGTRDARIGDAGGESREDLRRLQALVRDRGREDQRGGARVWPVSAQLPGRRGRSWPRGG